jgi:hypothetical protein
MKDTPHLNKLQALVQNEKLPSADKLMVEKAIDRYYCWISKTEALMEHTVNPEILLAGMVENLNNYKSFIDIDLIFDSKNDFLYRQKGQLKIDNSVIEEFLPLLCNSILIPVLEKSNVRIGHVKAFSGLYFESQLKDEVCGGGIKVRTKDQDFALCRTLWIKASHNSDYSDSVSHCTNLSYITAEIKTNLDKTMFQEAVGTAGDLKTSIPGAKYFLICDWLDMIPINTKNTPVDEVMILRHKRILPEKRHRFGSYTGRQEDRDWYVEYNHKYPYKAKVFQRLIDYIRTLLSDNELKEDTVLEQGYF